MSEKLTKDELENLQYVLDNLKYTTEPASTGYTQYMGQPIEVLLKRLLSNIHALEAEDGDRKDCPFSLDVGSEVVEQKTGLKYRLVCPLQAKLKANNKALESLEKKANAYYRQLYVRGGFEQWP